ncbi:MAG: glycosyltransferase [bacterium]
MNLSVIIPTYNRQEHLEKCLSSVFTQTVLPSEIVIIDDGILPVDYIQDIEMRMESLGIELAYYKKDHSVERRGLSESKNIAISIAKESVLLFLDDDIILEKDFIQCIGEVWENSDDAWLIGVGGKITNNRIQTRWEKLFHTFFGLRSKTPWDITDVGFQTWDEQIEHKTRAYYTHGGLCSLYKDYMKHIPFSTFSGGRTGLEDVDFCLRAKQQGYHFIYEPRARASHDHNNYQGESSFQSGKKETVNRKLIFKHHSTKNVINYMRFFWSTSGWILRQFLAGHFQKGMGMLAGLFL